MISITIVIISFISFLYIKKVANRDPTQSIDVYISYVDSFSELIYNGAKVGLVNISNIIISEHRIIVNRDQVSGGMWGALANSKSKYKTGYSNEYRQSKLHYKYKSDTGTTIEGETPYFSISEIKLTFILDNVTSMKIAYIEEENGTVLDSKLDVRALKEHL